MNRLELPINIRTAREDEIPQTEELSKAIKLAKDAEIVEGYKFFPISNKSSNFKFYTEININNSKLWLLFLSLTNTIPNPASFIYGIKDEEDFFGRYVEKKLILDSINKFKIELVEDGYLQFGVLHSTKELLVEVFITNSKYIKYWGVDQDVFLKIMKEFDLKENPQLKFIDEFPLVTEALRLSKPGVFEPEEVIENFNEIFNSSN